MSVSLWRYTEQCEGRPCPGDCDCCEYDPDEVTITPPTVDYGEILKPYKVYEKVKAVTVKTEIGETNDRT